MALKRLLQYFNIVALVALIVTLIAVYWYGWRPLPETGTVAAPVSSRVTIARDSLGMPHIKAASVQDALFAQGFATAADRLWQMDALRRLSSGRLAEVLGPEFLANDREARRFRLDRIAEGHTASLPPADRAVLTAYTRGVNHFIETHRGRLPLEFTLLGYDPRPWTVKDSILIALHMYRELTDTWRDKLSKSELLARGDPAKVAALFPSRLGGEIQPGSNAWVLAGSRTATGKPLLANDPHLEYSLPGIWYAAHLEAPGLDVEGVTLPGLPGVIVGHNDRIAWGVTNLGFDVQELYLEKLDPRTGRYQFRGQIEQAQLEREAIPVKGAKPVEFAQWITRHGAVFFDRGRAIAMRWAAADSGDFSFPILDLDRARDWREFTAALARYPGPGQNFVYADRDGNIGYHAAGRLPIRKYDGGVPVDGSLGDYEWEGYIPFEQLPASYNPESGMIVTANNDPFPENYPYRVRGNFAAPYRVNRIRELLNQRSKWRAGDMIGVQCDVYSAFARNLARRIAAAYDRSGAGDSMAAEAVRVLRSWDGKMDNGAAPLIATLAYQHLRSIVVERAAPGSATLYQDRGVGTAYQMAPVVLESLLHSRPKDWFENWDKVLLEALSGALEEGRRMQGRTLRKWDYGRYNELFIPNPVISRVPLVGSYFNIGPVPQSGSPVTVKQTTRRLGPSMRMAVDLADLDKSFLNLATGESGQALSPHYRDQWKAHSEARTFPMPFHRMEAKGMLTLEPERR